jgi:uncharacterized membrane protein
VTRPLQWLVSRRGADPHSIARETGRLEAFSDGVFAITITLLILETTTT